MPNPVVEALRRLQAIDKDLWEVRRRREERPRVLEAKKKELEARRAALAAQKTNRGTFDREADRANLDLKTAEEQILKYQLSLNTAKTNKEYTALQNQIGEKKAEKSKLEDVVLTAMTKQEALQAEYARAEAETKRVERELAVLDSEVKAEVAKLDAKIAEIQTRRDAGASGIDPEALARYEQVLQGRQGVAVVGVINGACQGCGKSLTPQEQNQLLKSSGLVICRACTRILFPADEGAWDVVERHDKA